MDGNKFSRVYGNGNIWFSEELLGVSHRMNAIHVYLSPMQFGNLRKEKRVWQQRGNGIVGVANDNDDIDLIILLISNIRCVPYQQAEKECLDIDGMKVRLRDGNRYDYTDTKIADNM